MYRLPEHYGNYLGSSVPSMSTKIFFGSIVIISLRPKVSSVGAGGGGLPSPSPSLAADPLQPVYTYQFNPSADACFK